MSENSTVYILITNLLGQEIKELTRTYEGKGTYSILVDLSGKPDGVYFFTVFANTRMLGKIKTVKIE